MSGRRSHPRFAVATPWDGSMRVLRDVVVDRVNREELLVISQVPGIVSEEMSLDLVGAGTAMELRVRVIESRPVIIEGGVRHRIRLSVIQPDAELGLADAPVEALETNARAEAV
jgi:hypothetical protein